MYVCLYVCTYVRTYVCMYACMCIYVTYLCMCLHARMDGWIDGYMDVFVAWVRSSTLSFPTWPWELLPHASTSARSVTSNDCAPPAATRQNRWRPAMLGQCCRKVRSQRLLPMVFVSARVKYNVNAVQKGPCQTTIKIHFLGKNGILERKQLILIRANLQGIF